jgi:hypothetical protein
MMITKIVVILRESGVSSIPKYLKFNISGAAYWITAFAGDDDLKYG